MKKNIININMSTDELLNYTTKEIIMAFGFVPIRVKKELSRLANFTKAMPKNARPEYKSHFSNNQF